MKISACFWYTLFQVHRAPHGGFNHTYTQSMPSISLITFNCFGTPTPRTQRRLLALADALNHSTVDIVCLQEVQSHVYRRLLLSACTTFPVAATERFIHAPKGGLLTLARLPMLRFDYTLYRNRGNMHTPALADWILHKGVLRSEFEAHGRKVVMLNTHLSANYRGDWLTENRYVREERGQLQQLAEIVAAQDQDAIVLVAGDFNVPRGSALFQDFLATSGLTDPLAGSTQPTYRPMARIPMRFAVPIDFALVRAPRLPNLQLASTFRFVDQVPLPGGRRGYLSDHIGVELALTWGAD